MSLSSAVLCAMGISLASGAVITGIAPPKGSTAGGTRIVVFGSGFNRDGKQGQTRVYIGNDECLVEEYDSGDSKLTCYTPPSQITAGGVPFEGPVDLRVALVQIGTMVGTLFADCPSKKCTFTYTSAVTPVIEHAVMGGSAGDVFYAAGRLFGDSVSNYYISVIGSRGQYASCDANDELNVKYDDLVDVNGYGVVKCYLGNIEAGRYNVSFEIREQVTNGYGQGLRRKFTKSVAPSADGLVHHFTQSPHINSLSYSAAGMNGGDELVVTGSGFSVNASNNVVTLPGDIPCHVISSSTTTITCRPGAATQESTPYVQSAPVAYPSGAGLVHTVYRGRNVLKVDPAGLVADETSLNLNALQGKFMAYGYGSYNDYYTEALSGFFVPLVSANYSFYCRGDDYVSMSLSSIAHEPGAAPATPTTEAVYVPSYSESFFSYMPRSPTYMEAGKRYPVRAWHYEGNGWDWFQCALRVHAEGNTVATAALRSSAQGTFRSMPSVQTITLATVVVREVQRITLTGAAGGSWIIKVRDGQSNYLNFNAIPFTVERAINQLGAHTGCGTTAVSRVTIAKTSTSNTTTTGFAYDVTFHCPTFTPFPILEVVDVNMDDLAGQSVSLTVERTQDASTALDGTFTMSLNGTATPPLSFGVDAWSMKATLLNLPGVQDIDVYRWGQTNSRDGSIWMVVLWAQPGPKPTIELDSSTVTGSNVSMTVNVLDPGSFDPFYPPTTVQDWFQTGYPRPAVRVKVNGFLAGCDVHKWNATAFTAAGGLSALPTDSTRAANPCGFEWASSLTPTLTSVTPASLTVGQDLVITGTGFLPPSAGVGAGLLGSDLNLTALNTVMVGDGECVVRSVAQDGTQLTCTLGAVGAGVRVVRVRVRMGRGDASAAPGANTVTVITTVTSVSPLVGSTAGGTLITVMGSGFLAVAADNVVTVAGIVCDPVALTENRMSLLCRTRTPSAGASSSGPIVINAFDTGYVYSFAAASTPELSFLSRNELSAATTGILFLQVTRASASSIANSPYPFTVHVGDRPCVFVNVTFSAGSVASVACKLVRKAGALNLPQPTYMPTVYVPPHGYAAPPAINPTSVFLDTGFRVHSVHPPQGSAHGGSMVTITGAGFKASVDGTTVQFRHTGPSTPEHDGHAVMCNVKSIAADGTSLSCLMESPDEEHETGWLAWGINVVGTLDVSMNKVLAPCGTATESVRNASACTFSFSRSATPTVTSVTFNDTAGIVSMAGSQFEPPMHVYFGGVDATEIVVNVDRTLLTARIPPQVVGMVDVDVHSDVLGYGHVLDFGMLNYTYALSLDRLPARAVNETGGSAAGGHALTLSGTGFSKELARNVVRFTGTTGFPASGYLNGMVMEANATRLVVHTPALALSFTASTLSGISLTVQTEDRAAPLGTVSVQAFYTFSAPVTPYITAVSPTIGMAGTVISITGREFGEYDAVRGSAVFVGGAQCTIARGEDWSASMINCTVGGTPAGTHLVLVTRALVGLARSKTLPVTFTSTVAFTAPDSPYYGGVGGGMPITIKGRGFAAPSTGGKTTVALCDTTCTVTGVSYSEINCTLGPLSTPAGLQALAMHSEHVIVGRGIASGSTSSSNVAAAFDGNVESTYSLTSSGGSCWVGLDMGVHKLATLTRMRWYAQYTKAPAFRNALAEGSADGSAWTALGTVGDSVQEGWNYLDVAGDVAHPVADWNAQPYFRYLRLRYGGASAATYGCTGMEVQFVGHSVATAATPFAAVTLCPINVTVTGPSDPYIGAASVLVSTLPKPVQYDVEATPVITSVSPNNGSALGGTVLTIKGTGFSHPATSSYAIAFNGVPCTVTGVSTGIVGTITCVTGARDMIRPPSLVVEGALIGGRAMTMPGKIYFRYLDKWSALTTWKDDEPPLEGDTVIVPAGQAVLVDVTPPHLFLVLVQGELVFDRRDGAFDANYILVHGGRFEVGTEAEPFLNQLTITLHGDRYDSIEIPEIGAKVLGVMNRGGSASHEGGSDMSSMGHGHGGSASSADAMAELAHGGSDMPGADGAPMGEASQGVLEIHGAPRKRVWTKVAATVLAGTDVVTTAEDVDFAPGETIVVTTSGYDPREAEERVVLQVLSAQSFRVSRPFIFTHESRMLPAGQYGHSDVDMRCEVGLLTRNVVIQGDEGSEAQVFGVHTIAAHGGVYRIENAELRRCGQQGQLGRYCTHQHMRGSAPNNYVRFNSIHHSFQRASTIHATDYTSVRHNFAYHIVGHSIFVEDGVERWNVIEENLVALTLPCFMCLKGDIKPASFWAASVENIWRHNVAAGCLGPGCNGYWHELPGNPHGPSYTTSICPVSGHLGEFFNNTARANDKGIRIYPVYLPAQIPCSGISSGGFPVYYVNNTFIRNRDNGIFNKRGGDIHHINAKVVETLGNDINWVILSVDFGWNPHIKDALIIGNTKPDTVPMWSKHAIHAPQDEFFFVSGVTVVNYDSPGISQGALAGCNKCESEQFMKQGGYTTRWRGLKFINSATRIDWTAPWKEIFHDLDGTLTGHVNGSATYYYAHNDWPECPRDTVGTYGFGTVCDGSTRIRRIQIDSVSPKELDYINMNVSQWSLPRDQGASPITSYHTWPMNTEKSAQLKFRPKDFYGYSFPLVTGRRYAFRWQSLIDWRQMRLRNSEPEYLTQLASPGYPIGTGEWTGVSFNWIDTRYRIRSLYTAATAANVLVDMPYNAVGAPAYNAPFGSSHLPDDKNKTWHTMLNARFVVNGTDLSKGPAWNRFNVNSLLLSAIQCAPAGCPVPPAAVLGNATKWSDALTWPSGRVPTEGSDVLIASNMSVTLDVNPPRLGRLTVEGRLEFATPSVGVNTPRRLAADAIVVWGEFTVGTAAAPYSHPAGVEIILNGVRTSPSVVLDNSMFLGNKVFVVLGKVSLVGPARVKAWTRLNATADAGATTIRLSDSVLSSAGAQGWSAGDRLVLTPSEYEPTEAETVGITTISADGRTLTLDAPLKYRHFAGFAASTGPTAGVRLASAVGLLSRSIVVRGNVTAPPDTFHATYGGHVYVGTLNRGKGSARHDGTLDARWVEFRAMGKGSMEHGAVNFQYGGYSLNAALDTDLQSSKGSYSAKNPPSTLQGCAFSSLNNYGLVAFATSHLTLDRNVWHDAKRSSIDFDAKSLNATITGNLVVGSYRSPDTGLASQYAWISPQAGMQLLSTPRVLSNNYVAGSIDAGYSLYGQDCAAASLSMRASGYEAYSGNEAVSTVIGVFALPQSTASGCSRLNGFTVWKAAHIGIVAVDGLTDLTVANAVVADSHIGVSLNFVAGKRGQARSDIVDSIIIGSSAASAVNNCSASVACRAYTKEDTLGNTCGSVLGTVFRRVGILLPQYTNRGKTCAVDGGLDVCRPPNRPERLCSMPWEKKYGLPSTRHTHAYLTNVLFSAFTGEKADCGKHSRAIMLNPTQEDMAVPVTMAGIRWDGTPVDARFSFARSNGAAGDDDSHNFALVTDLDGSVSGTSGSSILGSSPLAGLPSPACSWQQGWKGQLCPGVIFRQAIFESLDRDRGFRRLGGLLVTRPVGDGSSSTSDLVTSMTRANRTGIAFGPVDDGCALRFYFAQYPFLVRPGVVNHLLLPSTHPQMSRIHFFSPDAKESAVIRMFVQRANSNEVYVNGVSVKAKEAASATDFPALTDPAGTFLFDPQDKHITLTVRGGFASGNADTYDIVRLASVQLNFKLSVDVNSFFSGPLVSNLATLLGIDPSRIKVVSVHAGSTNVALEILPPANSTAALVAAASTAVDNNGVNSVTISNVTVSSNTTDAGSDSTVTNSTGGAGVDSDRAIEDAAADTTAASLVDTHVAMMTLVSKVTELAAAGSLSTLGGYAVEDIQVTAPPAPSLSPDDTAGSVLSNVTALNGTSVIVPMRKAVAKGLDSAQLAGAIVGAVVGAIIIAGVVISWIRARQGVRAITSGKLVGANAMQPGDVDAFAGSNPHFKPHAKVPLPPPTLPARPLSMRHIMVSMFSSSEAPVNFSQGNPMGVPAHVQGGHRGAMDRHADGGPRASARLGYAPQTVHQGGASHPLKGAWTGPSEHKLPVEGVHAQGKGQGVTGAGLEAAMAGALKADVTARKATEKPAWK